MPYGMEEVEESDMMIFIPILQLIAALILILVVLFQSGKSQGLSGAIGGIADSYMAKSKAKSLDAKLAKGTKWVGAVFIILTLVINCMLAAGIGAYAYRIIGSPRSVASG